MIQKNWIQSVITLALLLSITTILFLYTAGYRIYQKDKRVNLEKTGMIRAKSIPSGANVYLNGELTTATDDTIASLTPGKYNLKFQKKGFVTWNKDVDVFPELVTDITAVLISQSPTLEPLTNTGALNPSISPSLSKIVYFSDDIETPGIWLMPLSQSGIGLFKSNATVLIEDTPITKFSSGHSIEWAPDEKAVLFQLDQYFYLLDIENKKLDLIIDPTSTREKWGQNLQKKREDFIQKLELPDDIKQQAVTTKAMWSPDNKKFLYINQNNNKLEYKVYNMEKPLPVGEKTEYIVFENLITETQPKVSWYIDSYHLILTEGDIETNKQGIINLIRIDGTNKTEVYNNTLFSDLVFSAPASDKIIILTSFKSTNQTDLYTIGIR